MLRLQVTGVGPVGPVATCIYANIPDRYHQLTTAIYCGNIWVLLLKFTTVLVDLHSYYIQLIVRRQHINDQIFWITTLSSWRFFCKHLHWIFCLSILITALICIDFYSKIFNPTSVYNSSLNNIYAIVLLPIEASAINQWLFLNFLKLRALREWMATEFLV
jgi:hypothetical protein